MRKRKKHFFTLFKLYSLEAAFSKPLWINISASNAWERKATTFVTISRRIQDRLLKIKSWRLYNNHHKKHSSWDRNFAIYYPVLDIYPDANQLLEIGAFICIHLNSFGNASTASKQWTNITAQSGPLNPFKLPSNNGNVKQTVCLTQTKRFFLGMKEKWINSCLLEGAFLDQIERACLTVVAAQ